VAGANVLMGDGTVRFFSDNMDYVLNQHLHSRNGGESISDF
jgi:hypothetical protein